MKNSKIGLFAVFASMAGAMFDRPTHRKSTTKPMAEQKRLIDAAQAKRERKAKKRMENNRES